MKKYSILIFLVWGLIGTNFIQAQDVTPSGAFTYTYPIDIPAGTNGMQPNISLVYNSQAGNGIAGLGWTLTGFPVITRDTTYPINWDNTDHFIYNGQRLIKDSALSSTTVMYFHTENESFEVIKYIVDSYWIVTQQNGTMLYFGSSEDSRIEAQPFGPVRLWALKKVVDVNGNYYEIEYDESWDYWEYYPIKVTYTKGNDISTYKVIQFLYEGRPDVINNNRTSNTEMRRRLNGIEVSLFSEGGSASIYSEYQILYEDSEDFEALSLISEINRIDPESENIIDSCGFNWLGVHEGGIEANVQTHSVSTGSDSGYSQFHLGDFNGDGITDIFKAGRELISWIGLNDINGEPEIWSHQVGTGGDHVYFGNKNKHYFGDFNGDGRTDLFKAWYHSTSWIGLAGADGAFNLWDYEISTGRGWDRYRYEERTKNKDTYLHYLGDFNGDGRTDLFQTGPDSTSWIGLADADGNINLWDHVVGTGRNSGSYQHHLVDFNGDGRTDILRTGPNDTSWIGLADTDGDINIWSHSLGTGRQSEVNQHHLGDINGDGKIDLFQTGPNNKSWIGIAGLDGTIEVWTYEIDTGRNGTSNTFYLSDVNGDGRADLIRINGNKTYIGIATCSGIFDLWTFTFDRNTSYSSGTYFGDFDGDGCSEMLQVGSGTSSIIYDFGIISPVIDGITLLNNRSIHITYSPMSEYSSTASSESEYPYRPDTSPRQLVSVVDTYDPNSGGEVLTTIYQYYNGKTMSGFPDERKSLGFEWIKKSNPDGTSVKTHYYQEENDSLLAGLVKRQEISGSDGLIYSATEYSYEAFQIIAEDDDYHAVNFIKLTDQHDYSFKGEVYSDYDDDWDTLKSIDNKISAHKSYEYDDSLGTITTVLDEGDVSYTQDDTVTVTEYVQKESANITVPKSIKTYAYPLDSSSTTIISDDNISSYREFFYDGNDNSGVIGQKGQLTQKIEYSGEDDQYAYPDSTQSITYDDYGNIISVTDGRGFTSYLEYDSKYHSSITKKTNHFGQVIETNSYDEYNRLEWTMDINGNYTWYGYDEFHRNISVSEGTASGPTRTLLTTIYSDTESPDDYPRWIQKDAYSPTETGSDNYQTTITYYDNFGNVLQTKTEGIDESGSSGWIGVSYFYDLKTGETQVYEPIFYPIAESEYNDLPSSSERHTTTYKDILGRNYMTVYPDDSESYIKYGLKDRYELTRANNGNSTVSYQKVDEGVLKSYSFSQRYLTYESLSSLNVSDGWSYMTETSSGPDGSIIQESDSAGSSVNQLSTLVDNLGRKKSYTDPDMGTWYYEYDENGNLAKQTDAKNNSILFTYDELNRVIKKKGANTTYYTYDETGEEHGPDPLGRLTSVAYSDGTYRESYYYDDESRVYKVTKTIDGKSRTVTTTLDAIGRVIEEITPDGEVLNYGYKSDGSLSSLSSGETDYVSGFMYNMFSQIEEYDLGNGVNVDYHYNEDHYLDQILVKGSKTLADMFFTYDEWGNITQKSFDDDYGSNFSESFIYDAFSRLERAESDGLYDTREYAYDDINNMLEKDGYIYEYNGTGPHQVTSIKDSYGQTIKTYEYDANGNVTSITGQSHIIIRAKGTGVVTNPPKMELWLGGEKTDSTWIVNTTEYQNYYWNGVIPQGATIDIVFPNNNWDGGVDTNLLIESIKVNGVLIESQSSYVTADYGDYPSGCFDGESLVSNPDGLYLPGAMRFFITPDAAGCERLLFYDKENRLTTITDNGVTVATYKYDPSGQRIRTIVNGETTYHFFDNYEEVYGKENADDEYPVRLYKTSYYFANNQRVAYKKTLMNGSCEVYYYHQDHLGSSIRVSDSEGIPVQSIAYTPYGEVAWFAGEEGNRITFTGQEFDHSGFMYYNARYYDPELGRFLQADTVLDGLNKYTYCGNNPVRYVDPTGNWKTKEERQAARAERKAAREQRRADRAEYRERIRNATTREEKAEIRAQRNLQFGLEARTAFGSALRFSRASDNLRIARANGRELSEDWNSIDKMFLSSNEWGNITWNDSQVGYLDSLHAKYMGLQALKSGTDVGSMWLSVMGSWHSTTIILNNSGINSMKPTNKVGSALGIGSSVVIQFDPSDYSTLSDGTIASPAATLVHEVVGHGYFALRGINPASRKSREIYASAIDNFYRHNLGVDQRQIYGKGNPGFDIPLPQYTGSGFEYLGEEWDIPRIWGF